MEEITRRGDLYFLSCTEHN